MNKEQFDANVKSIEEWGVVNIEPCPSENYPFACELGMYTNCGGDMNISLECLDKESLQDYIDGFDLNEEVVIWWPNGCKGAGVPYDNIKEHYEDLEEWLEKVQSICNDMPY